MGFFDENAPDGTSVTKDGTFNADGNTGVNGGQTPTDVSQIQTAAPSAPSGDPRAGQPVPGQPGFVYNQYGGMDPGGAGQPVQGMPGATYGADGYTVVPAPTTGNGMSRANVKNGNTGVNGGSPYASTGNFNADLERTIRAAYPQQSQDPKFMADKMAYFQAKNASGELMGNGQPATPDYWLKRAAGQGAGGADVPEAGDYAPGGSLYQNGGGSGDGSGTGAWDAPFTGTFSYADYQKPADFVAPTRTALDTNAPQYTKRADYVPTTAADVNADPGVAFRAEQQQRAIQASQAAKGILVGGPAVKALTKYQGDLADQEYANVDARRMAQYQQGVSGDQQDFSDQMTTFGAKNGATGANNDAAYNDATGAYDRNTANAFQTWQANLEKSLQEFQSAYNVFTGNQDRAFDKNYKVTALTLPYTNTQADADKTYTGDQSGIITGAGTNAANGVTGAANAGAAGTVGKANAWSSGLTNIGKTALDASAYLNRNNMTSRGASATGLLQ